MSALPPNVTDRLHQHVVESRTPAFLQTDRNARLMAKGGHVAAFGLADVATGTVITEHVPFLHGLLPLERETEHLPFIEIAEGVWAEALLFRDHDGDWTVLLDASHEALRRQLMQQQGHELELLLSRRPRDSEQEQAGLTGALLRAFDAVVLERVDGDRLRVLGNAPEWLLGLWPSVATDEGASVQDLSPFLDNFLVDASRFWHDDGEAARCSSGMWTETGPGGVARFLEATALRTARGELLIVREVTNRYRERLRLQQHARDTDLHYDALTKHLERNDVLMHCIVHDLRSPLVSVQSGLQLIASEQLSDEAQRLVEVCRTQIAHEETMIRTILDVFTQDVRGAGHDPAEQSPVNVVERAEQTMAGLRPLFDLNEVALTLHVEDVGDDAPIVHADPVRMDRVFANLLENALRHSPGGGTVTVRVHTEPDSVFAFVDDEGPGVAPELAGQLFDRFSQRGGRPGNLGLGLHFCRITLEAWSGSVGHENREPRGSRFWFKLPRADLEP